MLPTLKAPVQPGTPAAGTAAARGAPPHLRRLLVRTCLRSLGLCFQAARMSAAPLAWRADAERPAP